MVGRSNELNAFKLKTSDRYAVQLPVLGIQQYKESYGKKHASLFVVSSGASIVCRDRMGAEAFGVKMLNLKKIAVEGAMSQPE